MTRLRVSGARLRVPGQTHVFLAGPDRQRGKDPRGKVITELTEGAGQKTHADIEVGGQRKMGTMLFDGGERHDDDRIAADRARHIARGHGLPVPNGVLGHSYEPCGAYPLIHYSSVGPLMVAADFSPACRAGWGKSEDLRYSGPEPADTLH